MSLTGNALFLLVDLYQPFVLLPLLYQLLLQLFNFIYLVKLFIIVGYFLLPQHTLHRFQLTLRLYDLLEVPKRFYVCKLYFTTSKGTVNLFLLTFISEHLLNALVARGMLRYTEYHGTMSGLVELMATIRAVEYTLFALHLLLKYSTYFSYKSIPIINLS